jgi:hypothetical protein
MAIHIKPSHKGLLHEDLGVAKDKPIPTKKLAKAEHSKDPAVKKRAVFAKNAKHFHHGGAKHASQPHPETNPGFYDTEPHAPGNKIADKPLTPPPAIGENAPAMVPQHPGRFEGLGGAPHHFAKPPMVAHGYGHVGRQRHGHVRLSGHSGAHRIGKK